jgi:hypothetical protein
MAPRSEPDEEEIARMDRDRRKPLVLHPWERALGQEAIRQRVAAERYQNAVIRIADDAEYRAALIQLAGSLGAVTQLGDRSTPVGKCATERGVPVTEYAVSRFEQIRRKRSLSLKLAASQIGIAPSTLYRFRHRINIEAENLKAIADWCRVTVEDLQAPLKVVN